MRHSLTHARVPGQMTRGPSQPWQERFFSVVQRWSALDLAADELLDVVVGLVVEVLDRRGAHEVRGGRQGRAPEAAGPRGLSGPPGVRDGAGGGWGGPD